MKRTRKALMLLLSAALTLPFALAACGDPDDGTSGPSAASESSSAGEESQEVFVDTDAIAAIDALYTGEVDRTLNKVNLAAGRTYTFSRDPSDPYLDADGKKLYVEYVTGSRAVPEPSVSLLGLLCVGGLLIRRRRQ